MNARKRFIGAASALIMAVGTVVAVAPAASAMPGGELINNHDGTVTASYDVGGADQGIYICDPTFTADDMSQCNRTTFSFGVSRGTHNLPPSPFVLTSGMRVTLHADGMPEQPLPAGFYTLVMAVIGAPDSDPDFMTGLQNVYLGPVAGAVIPPWVQAVGRFAADTCPSGWGASWQQWAVPVTGGYVCTREIPSLG